MYFPYIRAKQYDLSAIAELNDTICQSEMVVPIIEPTPKTSIAPIQYKRIADKNIPFILVVNPMVGPLKSLTAKQEIVTDLVNGVLRDYDHYYLGFIIQPGTTIQDVRNFILRFPNHKHAFIHFSQNPDIATLSRLIQTNPNSSFNIFIENRVSLDYINGISVNTVDDVLIRDGFVKQIKNEYYPSEDFFSELHSTYEDLGYDGFGDFTIIGSAFEPGGGPAYVVALHLTDINKHNAIIVKHFKSDITPPITAANPGGKFGEALRKLNIYLRANPGLVSDGVTDYRALHRNGNYPGLGIPKKISIKHHIEIVFNQL